MIYGAIRIPEVENHIVYLYRELYDTYYCVVCKQFVTELVFNAIKVSRSNWKIGTGI